MKHIKFGTSGHRGIIGKSFTNDHLIAIVHAISNYLTHHNTTKPRILIGYDTRTGNSPLLEQNSYTYTLVQELMSQKIMVDFCDTYTPTPIISWAIKHYKYDLGIILTASHNPPNYNGIKINDSTGAPAASEVTQWIETAANQIFSTLDPTPPVASTSSIPHVNYIQPFIDHLHQLLKQTFQLSFPDFSSHYVIDPKCGSAIDVWKSITASCVGTIDWKNDNFSSDFNFEIPDPTSKESILALSRHCKENSCIGFSNDPDADRHMIIDEHGNFISPEKVAAIIIDYCMSEEITIDSISTTLANSMLIKSICDHYNITCYETNIGFKYFTPFLHAANSQSKLAIGVESSGGFSISNHTFDKCGFLPVLLILAIMKKKNTSLHELSDAIDQTFSIFEFVEDAVEIPSQSDITLEQRLSIKQTTLDRLFTTSIDQINYNDGLKITFSNRDWVLCRPSGTEPLVRIYAESTSIESANHYIDQLKGLLSNPSPLE